MHFVQTMVWFDQQFYYFILSVRFFDVQSFSCAVLN